MNKSNALLLYIGQAKSELELFLSCAGTRLAANHFVYYSDEAEGNATGGERIYVIYDAYGRARSIGYIDGETASRRLSLQVRDLSPALFGVSSVEGAELATGYECSSFWTDRDGSTLIRFGLLDNTRGVFDSLPTGQLEIRIDASTRSASAAYYAAHDAENPLPAQVSGRKLSRQYNNSSYYLADCLAYERSFLLLGLTAEQADLVLGAGVDYASAPGGGSLRSYSARSLASDEAQFRYRYDLAFSAAGTVYQVSFRNRSLASREEVLLEESDYSFSEGMSLYEAYSQLQILPSWLELREDSLVLGYGALTEGEYEDAVLSCELTLYFEGEVLELYDYEFN
ncbi:MAG: hypothetical protein Q4B42_06210 [Oscillospiraceae bacterium]|nr:hypothetical protein [Oscillospiraceae bacterium]